MHTNSVTPKFLQTLVPLTKPYTQKQTQGIFNHRTNPIIPIGQPNTHTHIPPPCAMCDVNRYSTPISPMFLELHHLLHAPFLSPLMFSTSTSTRGTFEAILPTYFNMASPSDLLLTSTNYFSWKSSYGGCTMK
jgi:hypothetical protein